MAESFPNGIDLGGSRIQSAGRAKGATELVTLGQVTEIVAGAVGGGLGHTAVADTNYQAVSTDTQIGMTALTAPRTVFLPDVDAYPQGQTLFVADESGNCSETLPITVAIMPSSGDTIAGQSSHTLTSAYQGRGFRRGAANLWIFA